MSMLCIGIIRISIHALRVEGDAVSVPRADNKRISIHALRVEGDDVPIIS